MKELVFKETVDFLLQFDSRELQHRLLLRLFKTSLTTSGELLLNIPLHEYERELELLVSKSFPWKTATVRRIFRKTLRHLRYFSKVMTAVQISWECSRCLSGLLNIFLVGVIFFCNDNWFDVQEHSFGSFKLFPFTNEIFQKSRFNKDWLLIFLHV